MGGKVEISEVVISQLDWYVITKVRELRMKKKLSQDDLSVRMGFSEKLIGSIENPKLPARFNIRHLNILAKTLGCTLWDLLPERPLEHDLVKLKLKRVPKINKDGSQSKRTEMQVIDVKPYKAK
jgi:transcriptional regulator with XRE-family HTH domain